jgi:hypothetical protein
MKHLTMLCLLLAILGVAGCSMERAQPNADKIPKIPPVDRSQGRDLPPK